VHGDDLNSWRVGPFGSALTAGFEVGEDLRWIETVAAVVHLAHHVGMMFS